jgi:hypothetical protein
MNRVLRLAEDDKPILLSDLRLLLDEVDHAGRHAAATQVFDGTDAAKTS